MTVVSGIYKVCADIGGGSLEVGDKASNESWVIEKVDFQGVRTPRLRHLRK